MIERSIETVRANLSLVVNAGGQSRRMGRTKALLPTPPDGEPLIARVVSRLTPIVTGEVVVVTGDATVRAGYWWPEGTLLTEDPFSDSGPLGGIASGLSLCSGWAIVVACDMPFVDTRVFAYLQQLAGEIDDAGQPTWDVVAPVVQGRCEPMHALYHRRCLGAIEATLAAGDRKIAACYDRVRVRYVGEAELGTIDPALRAFTNVNTQQDWERVREQIKAEG